MSPVALDDQVLYSQEDWTLWQTQWKAVIFFKKLCFNRFWPETFFLNCNDVAKMLQMCY